MLSRRVFLGISSFLLSLSLIPTMANAVPVGRFSEPGQALTLTRGTVQTAVNPAGDALAVTSEPLAGSETLSAMRVAVRPAGRAVFGAPQVVNTGRRVVDFLPPPSVSAAPDGAFCVGWAAQVASSQLPALARFVVLPNGSFTIRITALPGGPANAVVTQGVASGCLAVVHTAGSPNSLRAYVISRSGAITNVTLPSPIAWSDIALTAADVRGGALIAVPTATTTTTLRFDPVRNSLRLSGVITHRTSTEVTALSAAPDGSAAIAGLAVNPLSTGPLRTRSSLVVATTGPDGSWSDPVTVSDPWETVRSATVAAANGGRAVAAYGSYVPDGASSIRLSQLDAESGLWSDASTVGSTPGSPQFYGLESAATPDGTVAIAWGAADVDRKVAQVVTVSPRGVVSGVRAAAVTDTAAISARVDSVSVSVAGRVLVGAALLGADSTVGVVGSSALPRPMSVQAPRVAVALVGATARCVALWSDAATLSYRWQVAGSTVSGATVSTFVPKPAMRGKALTCVVTARNATGARIAASVGVVIR